MAAALALRHLCRPLLAGLPAHAAPLTTFARLYRPTCHAASREFSTSGGDDFLAASGATFASLGLHPRVCESLASAGFDKPAQVQELAVPAILQERDVVLAAETGSGKTLSYLAPLVSFALDPRTSGAGAPVGAAAEAAAEAEEAGGGGGEAAAAADLRKGRTAALVLCPNVALCEQVVAVARAALRDPATGAPLAAAALVSSQSPPPLALPDVVVTTPAALLALLDTQGSVFGSQWTRAGLEGWARRVVLDEADLLLAGGYAKQVAAVLDALRGGDRERAARRACAELGVPLDAYWEMPRLLRKAVQQGGAKAALDAGYRPPPRQAAAAVAAAADASAADGGAGGDDWEGLMGSPSARVERPEDAPWRRQYVFVAATMPAEGGHTVGAELAEAFPGAVWLAGRSLHQAGRNVTHDWRRVEGPEHRAQVLREVVASDPLLPLGRGRMLVFAQDVASADATAEALDLPGGPAVLRYHRGVSAAARGAALARMASEEGLVLVCTDAAARGLDLPDVTHVVQADFAGNAVDFLHRVGRTARAGKPGAVTSMYGEGAAALVGAIRDAVEAGGAVEGAFSRKRSFSKKLKKYGGVYVPRGQRG